MDGKGGKLGQRTKEQEVLEGKLARVTDLLRVLSKVRQERVKDKRFIMNNLLRRGSRSFADLSQTLDALFLPPSHSLWMCLFVP